MILKYFILSALFFIASCATVLDGRKQQLAFDSNEKEVQIFVNDKFVCTTPCITDVKRKKNKIMITAKKDGFENRAMFIDGNLNSTTVINILSLWSSPFGASTDLSTGGMWQYFPNSIYVTMQKEPKTPSEKRAQLNQNKIRDFVLRNFDHLQTEAFQNEGMGEYIKTLANMSQLSENQIKSILQNAYAAPDATERVIGEHLNAMKK